MAAVQESVHLREFFLKYGHCKHYDSGAALACEGDLATEVCYIASGEVRAYCSSPDGEDLTLFYVGAGNMIFTEALMQGARILRNSETTTPVDLYSVPAGEFTEMWLAEGYPLQEIFSHLIGRFELLHEYICCAHFKENDRRVAYLLYTNAVRSGSEVRLGQEQIASITGVNRVTVSRILSGFSRDGYISQGYKKILVLQPEKLAAVFNSFGCGVVDSSSGT